MSNTKEEDLFDAADVLVGHTEEFKIGGQKFTVVRPADVKALKQAIRRFR